MSNTSDQSDMNIDFQNRIAALEGKDAALSVMRERIEQLKAENAELKSVFKEAADYLDFSDSASIDSTSIFHAQFRGLGGSK